MSAKYKIGGRFFILKGYGWFEVGGSGGAGAVDLVMRALECASADAVEIILRSTACENLSFPISSAKRLQHSATSETSDIPQPQPQHWPTVFSWLTNERGLDCGIINSLHDQNLLFAGQHANAVFLCRSGLGVVGCEIRGTSSKRFAGKRGNRFFELMSLDKEAPTAAVESAIDAISLRQLGHAGRIVSTGGALGSRALEYLKTLPGAFYAAFDADQAGEEFSLKMQKEIQMTSRILPGFDLKDWNDVLRASR